MVVIKGVVLDKRVIPIENALVAISAEWDNTNHLGEFSISVPPGTYVLKVIRKGYRIYRELKTFDTDTELEITLK